jgi:carbonic anhydrase/acetyltransferase-like protein (isoleucine patch superfamily)
MIIGSPAKAVRELSSDQQTALTLSALYYTENAHRFRVGLRKIA